MRDLLAALRCRFAPPPIRLRRPYNAEIIPRAHGKELSLLYTDFARARQRILLNPLAARACS
jgi:hypothetical protein